MENRIQPNPTEPTQGEEGLNLRHYWHVILERRWLVIATFISVFVLCLIYLYKAEKVYQAVVQLEIEREGANVVAVRDPFQVDAREQDYLQTQYKKLKSRTLILEVINELHLDEDPRYTKKYDKVKAVFDDIQIEPVRLSRLVFIRVEHTKPKQAQAIANKLVERFVYRNLDQKKEQSLEALTSLRSEIDIQKLKVSEAEQKLQEYRAQIGSVSVEDSQNIVYQDLLMAGKTTVEAEGKAIAAEELNKKVQRLLTDPTNKVDIESIPQVTTDKLIQGLKEQLAMRQADLRSLTNVYGTNWPTIVSMQNAIDELKQKIVAAASNTVAAIELDSLIANSQFQELTNWRSRLETNLIALGTKRVAYSRLSQEADQARNSYVRVLQAAEDLNVAIHNKINNMNVVDRAYEPIKPVKPRTLLTLFLGFFGGLAAACGLAFFVNYLDDSIKTQDDVEAYLRLPFLGYVPNIKSNSVIERDLQAHVHPQSTAAEGFRTIRAAVSLMPNADKYHVLVVTSTIPSEGKSLLASNLAIVTAQTGLKTLLVDADLRRPSVHKAFQLHSPIGLSAFLNETVSSMDEIVHTTEVPNLDVICAGAIPSNPSELAGSKRMRQFLQEAKGRYDRVFVDCPPVSAVSDPLVLSAMADGVLFLTKFNKIRREHARKSIQRIQDAGIHLLGVVLNDIDFEGKDSYYYSYYYYQNRYYSSHYRSKKGAGPGTTVPLEKSE
jgi:succinoglycan biosynthesis transport protein ExoP